MYEVLKRAVERLESFLRVRNAHQLHGPTLLRAHGTGRGPKRFRRKNV